MYCVQFSFDIPLNFLDVAGLRCPSPPYSDEEDGEMKKESPAALVQKTSHTMDEIRTESCATIHYKCVDAAGI